ncbi:hypothetical protein ACRQ5D_04810 [Mucilaginibacter sp. P25]|uniref:hypothetical protein n=1 Tax=Mucilaginibacter TaxID=423349 RepID=UPI0015A08E2C|nr:hypothetical protein [Mucilaginibacter gossypii]
MTDQEKVIVQKAFVLLPPLHQRTLKIHLKSISVLDDMPNTALTVTLNSRDSSRKYHIAIRAAILKPSISEWLTEKETSCFDTTGGKFNIAV